jgi:hypothetical protein
LRIEQFVDAMFLEDVRRNERQLVNGFTEFRGHASGTDRVCELTSKHISVTERIAARLSGV